MAAREDELPGEEMCFPCSGCVRARWRRRGLTATKFPTTAKAGFACRHNRVYWRRGEYLGFGCAAHSFFGGERFRNASDLEGATCAARGGWNASAWTAKRRAEETVMLATRTREGLSLENWRKTLARTSLPGAKRLWKSCARTGLLEIADGHVYLTEKGMEVHNAVVLALL